MNFKKVCPRDCPGRYPGCGVNCPTWQEHRAESLKRYADNLARLRVGDVLQNRYEQRMRTWRKSKRA